jgi:hypothetical protein
MHMACERNHADMVALLHTLGASLDSMDCVSPAFVPVRRGPAV